MQREGGRGGGDGGERGRLKQVSPASLGFPSHPLAFTEGAFPRVGGLRSEQPRPQPIHLSPDIANLHISLRV